MSKIQRRTLQLFLRFRDRPPTIPGLLWTNRGTYALTALLFGAMAYFLYFLLDATAAGYVGVASAAIILRDVGYFRRTVALWPMYQTIIDWENAAWFGERRDPALPGQD